MTKMSVEYKGSLRTKCSHEKSGSEILTDAPTDNHGKGEAFSPTDLMGASLASCMITVMAIAGQKREMKIGQMNAQVEKTMASDPRRIAKIGIKLEVENMNYSEKEKAVLERAARECPVALSLHPELNQELHVVFV